MWGRGRNGREIEWNLGILDVVISTVKWPNKILFVHKDICNSCTIVDWFRFFPLDVGLLWLNHVSARVHLLFIIFVWFNFFSFISFCMLAVVKHVVTWWFWFLAYCIYIYSNQIQFLLLYCESWIPFMLLGKILIWELVWILVCKSWNQLVC